MIVSVRLLFEASQNVLPLAFNLICGCICHRRAFKAKN